MDPALGPRVSVHRGGAFAGLWLGVGVVTLVAGAAAAVVATPWVAAGAAPIALFCLWLGLDELGSDVHLHARGLVVVKRGRRRRALWDEVAEVIVLGRSSASGAVLVAGVALITDAGGRVAVPQVHGIVAVIEAIREGTRDALIARALADVRRPGRARLGAVELDPDGVVIKPPFGGATLVPWREIGGVHIQGGRLHLRDRRGRSAHAVEAEAVVNVHVVEELVAILSAEAASPDPDAPRAGTGDVERLGEVFD